MKKYNVKSPLVKDEKAYCKEEILVSKLVSGYKKKFNIDINESFSGKKKIYIYQCSKTGYQFFYPLGIEGDGRFYEKLEKFDWYYMPWKWEHETTKQLLQRGDKILEIGSGGLGFVEKINNYGFDITGLELNKQSISRAQKLNLKVYNELIEEHSKGNSEIYDVVCSYQVLEHISEPYSFLKAQIDCLKVGGKLIISVPNNNSFIRLTKGGILNMPPHHMGLWNKKSLKNLTKIFNLEVQEIKYEPLQKYHLDWYVDSIIEYKFNTNYLLKLIFRNFFSRSFLKSVIWKFNKLIHGHTIMIIYRKY